jgi:hypothetical protein
MTKIPFERAWLMQVQYVIYSIWGWVFLVAWEKFTRGRYHIYQPACPFLKSFNIRFGGQL